ncbi:MAG TPA: DNA polymerase III subunit gamma/tau [Candidatus Eremiobacteraceae bacterium]|nr:DNA polymerase III subunit gamma/tau [Candidatus Eremiobacteraceae bacterium]
MATQFSPSELALYRKHRPAGFDDLVGQPAVVEGLTAALRTGRIAHAYLFSGPRGTGKTSAARILARCLNCETDGPRPDPCGRCAACLSVADGTSFDVVEMDAASNRGIEQIRELRNQVAVPPAYMRKKVYIIDEVHMVTPEGFNALLKTLEEPPDYAVFILATTDPSRVPATILSRCQRFDFRRMQPDTIAARLADVAKREGIKIGQSALQRLAFLADGALRDALVLLEQARGFADGATIDQATLDRAFGESHRDIIGRLTDATAQGDPASALQAVADAVGAGADPVWLAKELLRRFRLVMIAQNSPATLALETPPDDAAAVVDLAKRLDRTKVLQALKHLSEALAQRYSTQPRIDLELALVRIIVPSDELNLTQLSDRLRILEERASVSGVKTASARPEPSRPSQKKHAEAGAASRSSLTAAKLEGLWPMVLTEVRASSMQLFGILQKSSIVEASADEVTLGAQNKFAKDHASDPPLLKIIGDAIAKHTGETPRVRFVVSAALAPTPPPDPFASASALDLI